MSSSGGNVAKVKQMFVGTCWYSNQKIQDRNWGLRTGRTYGDDSGTVKGWPHGSGFPMAGQLFFYLL